MFLQCFSFFLHECSACCNFKTRPPTKCTHIFRSCCKDRLSTRVQKPALAREQRRSSRDPPGVRKCPLNRRVGGRFSRKAKRLLDPKWHGISNQHMTGTSHPAIPWTQHTTFDTRFKNLILECSACCKFKTRPPTKCTHIFRSCCKDRLSTRVQKRAPAREQRRSSRDSPGVRKCPATWT